MTQSDSNLLGNFRDHDKIRSVHSDIIALFKKWWDEDVIPKENKAEFENGFKTIKIPYMSLIILNTGDFISANQYDDILDALKEPNKEAKQAWDEIAGSGYWVLDENTDILDENGLRKMTKEDLERYKGGRNE